jgi:hypothetical protein
MSIGTVHRTGVRQLALDVAVVALFAVASLVAFFIIGGPFGFLNDLANAAIGVLSAMLAWRSLPAAAPISERLAATAAFVGAVIMIIGSVLIISDITGWYLAGLVSSLGAAFIGAWLVVSNRGTPTPRSLPTGIRRLGTVAGIVMLLGVCGVPGLLTGIDDPAAAPWLVFPAQANWLGTYLLYPVWCLRLATKLHQLAKI